MLFFHSCLASHPLFICLGHRLLIRLCIFMRHGGQPYRVGGNPHGFVVFFVWCGSGPVLCCFAVFSVGETQIWPGDLRVVAVAVSLFFVFFFSMVCLVCEAKGFHTFCTLFYRFSHCQDRALERDRPQQRKKQLKPRASCTPKFQQGSTVTNLQVHPCWNYKLRVPVSLAFSWCQYILRDVASARPRGASKRLDWKLSKPFITERERL